MRQFIAKKYQVLEKPTGNMSDRGSCPLPLINLGIGDLDITTDESVIEKTMLDAKAGYTHYTDPYGLPEVRKKICAYLNSSFKNYDFDYTHVMMTSSATHGLYITLKSILDKGDEVILLAPFFAVYKAQIMLSDGQPVIVHTKRENGYQIIKEDLEHSITSKTKAIILNTPCNPTGVCYTQKSLEAIRDIAKKYDLLVIADDVYDFYSYQSPFIPAMTIDGMRERCVSVCSFSKDYAMTGWRIGYIVSDVPNLIDTIELLNESIMYSAPAISQRAALHAIENQASIKGKNVPLFKERVDYCYDRIQKIKFFDCFKPQGGFYFFVDVLKSGMNGHDFSKYLLENCNVLVLDGAPFGDPNSVRIACTVNIEKLKEAFDRIEKYIKI